MAKRKKRTAAPKSKSKKVKRTTKKSVKRVLARKSRRTSKGVAAAKTSRRRTSRPKRASPQKQSMVPVVEGEIIDVVDEPMPGVVRVTEVETARVTVPDTDEDDEE